MKLFICALATVLITPNAGAFDCKLAKTPSEKLICSDKALQEADQSINKAYRERLKSLSSEKQAELKASQKAWLSQRDQQCPGAKCLLDYMNERLKALAATNEAASSSNSISCKPNGKNGAHLTGAFTGAPVDFEKVANDGAQPVTARIQLLELIENGKKVTVPAPLDLEGTAENSAKGPYFELKPKGASPIKGVFIGAAAGGPGNSTVTAQSGKEYTMDCE
jgi:uncharacterized protein